jgi:hypothetical protein
MLRTHRIVLGALQSLLHEPAQLGLSNMYELTLRRPTRYIKHDQRLLM